MNQMPLVTIGLGSLLTVLGIVGYFLTGMASITALIPAFFGVVFIIVGTVARQEKWLKHMMHAAVLLGLFGFVGTVRGLTKLPALLAGETMDRAAAVVAQSVMSVLCLAFVGLCVWSFVLVRRKKAAAANH